MTNYLLSIDPGVSTGIVLASYTDTTPVAVEQVWQVPGGLTGFKRWMSKYYNGPTYGWGVGSRVYYPVRLIAERFVPLSGGGFSHTSDTVEPLRIEGALRAWGIMPDSYDDERWQRPQAMVLASGATRAERKKNSDNVLRHMGLWHTGKQVGMKDANDVNSACKHLVAYLKKTGHQPTIDAIEEATK